MMPRRPPEGSPFALVVESGPLAPRALPLQQSITIGRGVGADLRLDDPTLSRRHARVDLIDDVPVLVDLQSTNGSYVNGLRAHEPVALWVGDRVQLGRTLLRLERIAGLGPLSRAVAVRWQWPWIRAAGETAFGVGVRLLAGLAALVLGLLTVALAIVALVLALTDQASNAVAALFGAEVAAVLAFGHAYVAGRLRANSPTAHSTALGLAALWLLALLGLIVAGVLPRWPLLGALVGPLLVGLGLLLPGVRRCYRADRRDDRSTPPAPAAYSLAPPRMPVDAEASGLPIAIDALLHDGPFAALSPDWQAWLARQARLERYAPGDAVVREGDRSTDLYVVSSGQLEVVGQGLGGSELGLAQLGPGTVFGEMAALTGAPRTATIRATMPALVACLPGAAVGEALRAVPRFREALRRRVDYLDLVGFLQRFSPFAGLPAPVVVAAVRRCQRYQVPAGTTILQAGAVPDAWYLIKQGVAECRWAGGASERLGPGDSFGASGATDQPPSPASIVAQTPLELVALPREDLGRAVATYPRLRRLLDALLRARFAGATDQPLALPDPVSTIMPGLARRARGRYWLLLAGGVVLLAALSWLAATTGAGLALAACVLVGSLLAPVVYLRYLWERDLLRSLSTRRLLGIGLSGGVGAVVLALILSNLFPTGTGALLPALGTGLVEETAKAASATWLMWRRRYRFELDGIVFGVATGMAFAAVENVLYAGTALMASGVVNMLVVLWMRAFTTFAGHGVWTGLICAAIWRGKGAGSPRIDRAVVAAFAIAVLLHALWDWSPVVFAIPVAIVGMLLLRYRVQQAVAAEQEAIVALAAPVGAHRRPGGAERLAPRANCGEALVAGNLYCVRCGAAQMVRDIP
ncbi:MAG: cyclic nucleotide-binding domain-containing protein [Chloroflexi bacterium]|nr:cyclic nucleotide-binding domain-containing protein [Chloroflexota bacterium]